MKKLLTFIIASTLILFGCGSEGSTTDGLTSNPDDHTLTIWAWDPNYNIPMIQEAADMYKEAIDPEFEIEILELGQGDINQKMQTVWSANSTDDLPDIVLKDNPQIAIDVASYGDVFVPLSEYIDYSEFNETVVKQVSVNDNTYAMPLSGGPSALMYRKDLFEQAGYTEADMEDLTWDQYLEMSNKVYEVTGVHGLSMDVAAWTNPAMLEMIMSSMNIWYPLDPATENLQDNPDFVLAMEELVKISNDDSVLQTQNDWNAMVSSLVEGDVASFPGPIWMVPTMQTAENQDGKWAIAEFPRVDGALNGVNAANWGASSWAVTTASDNQELAVDFLSYAYTNTDYYEYIAQNYFVVPYYLPAAELEFFDTYTIDLFGEQPIFPEFIDSQNSLEYVDRTIYNQVYVDALQSQIPNMVQGTCTVDECLGVADEQVKDQY